MSNKEQIEQTIQTYYDCMCESSAEKVHEAFHPNAKITGYLEDGLHEMTVSEFASFIESQQPSPKESGGSVRLDVLSISIAGNIAVAQVRDDYLGMVFLDILTLLKDGGKWSIYNKLFHVEEPANEDGK